MPLRPLLAHLEDDPAASTLAREGGRAFVSSSLRPYVLAALAEADERARGRAHLIVAGDDRAARDLAGDLRAWLWPRRVRYYPTRGVTYESHLIPPPHLVGLRLAALDALLGEGGSRGAGADAGVDGPGSVEAEGPIVVVSAVALSEKVPDPALRPRSFRLRVGELLDLDECATELVAAGYERVDQVEERGQFALRGGLLDVFPATEERAVRVDMFDVEIESLRWFSTFTQRSLGEVQEVEIAPAAELAEEHRALATIAGEELAAGGRGATNADDEGSGARPDIAELLPIDRFGALLDLVGEETRLLVAAEEELAPALGDHWSDVCAAFGDEDAHHLYVDPDGVQAALRQRARIWLSAISADQPIELRAQSADTMARTLAEAEPELEKLVRSGYRTVVAFPRRGEGERAAYNLGRLKASWLGEGVDAGASPSEPSLRFAAASLREGFVAPSMKLAIFPEHRLLRRRRAERGGAARGPAGGRAGTRRGALRSFAELRAGDVVVHEDHGVARFAGFETRTVAGVTRDYLYLEYQGDDRVFVPVDQLAKISRYVGAGGENPPLSKLGGTRWETMKARARRAAQELSGELLSLYAENLSRRLRSLRPPTSATRSSRSRSTWRSRGRWTG